MSVKCINVNICVFRASINLKQQKEILVCELLCDVCDVSDLQMRIAAQIQMGFNAY